MTKLRDPDTIHEAVRRAQTILGDAAIAAEFGCTEALVQAWSNRDDDREISAARAARLDALLVQRGFDAVFAPLFVRLAEAACPLAVAEPVPSPLTAVLAIAGTIGGALSTMAKAARDGSVNHGEIHACLKQTEALGLENARCRRALFAALRRHAPSAAVGKRGR